MKSLIFLLTLFVSPIGHAGDLTDEIKNSPYKLREFVSVETDLPTLGRVLDIIRGWEAGYNARQPRNTYPGPASFDPFSRILYLGSVAHLMAHSDFALAQRAIQFFVAVNTPGLPGGTYENFKNVLEGVYRGTTVVSDEKTRRAMTAQFAYLYLMTLRTGGRPSTSSPFIEESYRIKVKDFADYDVAMQIAVAQATAIMSIRNRGEFDSYRSRLKDLLGSSLLEVRRLAVNALLASPTPLTPIELEEDIGFWLVGDEEEILFALEIMESYFAVHPLPTDQPMPAVFGPVRRMVAAVPDSPAVSGSVPIKEAVKRVLARMDVFAPPAPPPPTLTLVPTPPAAGEGDAERQIARESDVGPPAPSPEGLSESIAAGTNVGADLSSVGVGTPLPPTPPMEDGAAAYDAPRPLTEAEALLERQTKLESELQITKIRSGEGYEAALTALDELKKIFPTPEGKGYFRRTYLDLISTLREYDDRLKERTHNGNRNLKERMSAITAVVLHQMIKPIVAERKPLETTLLADQRVELDREKNTFAHRVRRNIEENRGETITVPTIYYMILAQYVGTYPAQVARRMISATEVMSPAEQKAIYDLIEYMSINSSYFNTRTSRELKILFERTFPNFDPNVDAFSLMESAASEEGQTDSEASRAKDADYEGMNENAQEALSLIRGTHLSRLINDEVTLANYFHGELHKLDTILNGVGTMYVYDQLCRHSATIFRMLKGGRWKGVERNRLERLQKRIHESIDRIQSLTSSYSGPVHSPKAVRESKQLRTNLGRFVDPSKQRSDTRTVYPSEVVQRSQRGLDMTSALMGGAGATDAPLPPPAPPAPPTAPPTGVTPPAPVPPTAPAGPAPSAPMAPVASDAITNYVQLMADPKADLGQRLRAANRLRVISGTAPLTTDNTLTVIELIGTKLEEEEELLHLASEIAINSLSSLGEIKVGPQFIRFSRVVGDFSSSRHPNAVVNHARESVVSFAGGNTNFADMKSQHHALCLSAIINEGAPQTRP